MRGLRGVVASVFAVPDRALVAVLGLIISFAAFYSSGVGVFDETISRVGTLGVAMALGLLAFPLPGRIGRVFDILLLLLGVVIFWRYFQIGAIGRAHV